ncbi:MAG: hypothetical protein JWL97_4413 [Gemmatimonadales bacterium]|nr:hypothetical protein [Gemmatimonadales bacterium]
MTRRPAFDPAALDDSLGGLTAPLSARPVEPAPAWPRQRRAVVVAVRIPRHLYEEVARRLNDTGRAHPSYAQLVAWTCEDKPDAVVTLLEQLTRPAARRPRGRRPASDSVPLTLRFRPDELQTLDAVAGSASSAIAVTRTAAVTAALRVWTWTQAAGRGQQTPDDVASVQGGP